METILSIIGFFVVIKFCIRNRRCLMDKKMFKNSVDSLREAITKGWTHTYLHRQVDDIVHNVLGEPEMENIENLDENLTAHLIKHIQAIKQAKEQAELKEKAEKVLATIKELIEND